MAVRSGNGFAVQPLAGRVVPTVRAQGPTAPAAAFEAVGATSGQRTVVRHADLASRVWSPAGFDADGGIRIVRPLAQEPDARLWITRPVREDGDTALRVHRPFASRGDTRQAVSVRFDRSADVALGVLHPVDRDAAARQTVYAVLIRESHEIQT